jgi:hypothetical protein
MTDTWQEWLQQQREGVKITTQEVLLTDQVAMSPWRMLPGGFYGREGGGFWTVKGQEIMVTRDGQQVAKWAQPLIQSADEGSHGYLVLAWYYTTGDNAEDYYLLCTDMAPGRGTLELRPTLQASKSKLEMQPNFPRCELAAVVEKFVTVPCDANVFNDKTISVAVTEFADEAEFVNLCGEILPNERWFTRKELRQAMAAGEVNDHLATVLFTALI